MQTPTKQFGIVNSETPLDRAVFVKRSPCHKPDLDSSSCQGYQEIKTEENRKQIMAQQATWLPKKGM